MQVAKCESLVSPYFNEGNICMGLYILYGEQLVCILIIVFKIKSVK